jgi:hypothetical protein
VLIAAAAVVTAIVLNSSHTRTVRIAGWESADRVAVPGEPVGTCGSAWPPNFYEADADQWIVCGSAGRYHCFRQRLHTLKTKQLRLYRPIRPAPLDASCRAALRVLREVGYVR